MGGGEVQSPLEKGVLSPFHRKEIEGKDEDSLQSTLFPLYYSASERAAINTTPLIFKSFLGAVHFPFMLSSGQHYLILKALITRYW